MGNANTRSNRRCFRKSISSSSRSIRKESTSSAHSTSSNNYHLDTRQTNPFEVFQEHIVLAMVGLPARGKSYLSCSIIRYMNFLGCRAKLFNAGSMRRQRGLAGTDATFFDPSNESAKAMREEMAMECLEQLLQWVKGDGCSVGILDATNTTVARRAKLIERCRREELEGNANIRLVFVESMADDPVLLESNYRMKLSNDDYNGADKEKALADFRERVKKYEAVYEPISDDADGASTRYIRLINAGQKLISNNLDGYVTRKIQRLLGSVHLKPRNISLVLVGETESDICGILGGDPDLSSDGIAYSRDIFNVISKREHSTDTTLLITGTLQRYKTMVREYYKSNHPPCDVLTLGAANDLCSGLMDSLSFSEREEEFPEETAARSCDKLNYRYPGVGGESYQDLIARCNEIVCHLEQTHSDAIVIADRSVYRALMGYFTGKSIKEVPFLDVQPGVLELRRSHSGFGATQLSAKEGKATSSAGVGTRPYLNSLGSRGQLRSESMIEK